MKHKKKGQDRQRAASMPGRKHRGIYLTDQVYEQANAQAGKLTFSHYVEQLILRDGQKKNMDEFFDDLDGRQHRHREHEIDESEE